MARLNKVIELLEEGKVVFGGGMAWTGNIDEAMAFADMGYDFVIFEISSFTKGVAKAASVLRC
jgi:hypothetical protein